MRDRDAPPPSVKAFFAGRSGSGKTEAAVTFYMQHFPRRLMLDSLGEWPAAHVDAVCYDQGELFEALNDLAPRGAWSIALPWDKEEFDACITEWWIPTPFNAEDSIIRRLGGAALLLDEMDLFCPPGMAGKPTRSTFQRSRHIGLSIIGVTQYPAAVSRVTSSQVHHKWCFQLDEPRHLEYMASIMHYPPLLDAVTWWHTNPHGAVMRDEKGIVKWIDATGNVVPPPTTTGELAL